MRPETNKGKPSGFDPAASAHAFAPVRLSTSDVPGRDCIPFWRDVMGRQMLHVNIEPLSDRPFELDAVLRAMPGLRTMHCASSGFCMQRTHEIVAASNDDIGLVINLGEKALVRQCGREVTLGRGDAAPISNSEQATFMHSGGCHIGVIVPRSAVALLTPDIDTVGATLIRRQSAALRLLVAYLHAVHADDFKPDTIQLYRFASAHIHELLALALGTAQSADVVAEGHGVRAARMRAMRAYIAANLANAGLSVGAVARREGVTPRYVQLLFESAGTTFSRFVTEQRLERARRMLGDARYRHWRIGAIAYEAGFGDLSHFNRSFRRRYGDTPSAVRDASA